MNEANFIFCYDIGTTENKACLYQLDEKLDLVVSAQMGYPLIMTDDGGAEQKVGDWWNVICVTTRDILYRSKIDPHQVKGISFCCQMQGFIPVDQQGNALRNPMIYLDGRSTKQIDGHLDHGLFKIESMNGMKVLKSLYYTGGMAATAKDPLWKYHWMRENEPELFADMYKWLDVKDYLNLRCTGNFTMTRDSANLTFLYDTRPGHPGWNQSLCRTFQVDMHHLPEVITSTDVVGGLTIHAAADLGLMEGTPVFGGGGDTSCIGLGAGCTDLHDTHIYIGTSGWVSSNVNKRMVDVSNFIASIFGAMPGRYNYIAEQETSGLCLQWVRDHLALDEIGVYLRAKEMEGAAHGANLYDLLNKAVSETAPGADGVIFTPWLHGNRAPREDPFARAMFFNIGLKTGKRKLIRAVLEGVAYHKRWMLEAVEKKIPRQERIRFIGGGARSEVWCQIMADVTGREIETIANPQDAGAVGAAMICGVGLGIIPSFEQAKQVVPSVKTYRPRTEFQAVYERNYGVFKQLYRNNRKLFWTLNKLSENG